MACCTFLSDNECTAMTTDAELNRLLTEVRAATGEDWRIREIVCTTPRWFRRPLVTKYYELFAHLIDVEFQSINFYRPDREREGRDFPSINLLNGAEHVASFLYGMQAGIQSAQRPERAEVSP